MQATPSQLLNQLLEQYPPATDPTSNRSSPAQPFTPLDQERRPTVSTAAAAFYLNRKPQTLRCWAVYQNGAVSPIRVCGRLAWNVSEIRKVLGVSS